jgi:hypothetical protein
LLARLELYWVGVWLKQSTFKSFLRPRNTGDAKSRQEAKPKKERDKHDYGS